MKAKKAEEGRTSVQRNVDMISQPLLPAILRYGIPIMLTGTLQLLFNAADLVVVGQFCGSVSVGAVGATSAVTNLLVNFFMGLSIGAGVDAAQSLGARDEKRVHEIVHTAIPVGIIGGLLLSMIGCFAAGPMLRLLKTPAAILPLAVVYMRIVFIGVPFCLLYNFGAAILRAAGDTRSPLIFLTFSGALNVVFNLFFVMVLHLNVAGVALATVIAQAISAGLVLREMRKRQDACRLNWKQLHINRMVLVRMIRIGLPAGIQSSLFSLANMVIQSSINSFGDVLVSANAAVANIEGFIYTISTSFQQTTVNFVGQNVGAHRYDRVRKTLWLCMGCGAAITLVVSLAAYAGGPALLSIYLSDSPEAVSDAMVRMLYVCVWYFLFCPLDMFTGALRGMGESLVPMIMAVAGICGFRILWASTIFQLPAFHTPEILYLVYPISWVLTGICEGIAFLVVYRRFKGD